MLSCGERWSDDVGMVRIELTPQCIVMGVWFRQKDVIMSLWELVRSRDELTGQTPEC